MAGPADTPKRHSYREGAAFTALSLPLLAGLGLVGAVVTGRMYGVRTVGEFALVTAPVLAMWFLSTLREQAAMVREIAKLEPRDPRVTGIFAATFAFSMAITVLVSAIAAAVTWFVFHGGLDQPDLVAPAIVSLALYTFVKNPAFNVESLLTCFVAGRPLFWVRLHEQGLTVVLFVVFGIVEPSVWGLVAATYVAQASSLVHRTVIARRYMRFRVPRAEIVAGFRMLPDMLRFSVRFAPGLIFNGISYQSATWILGFMSTVTVVGAFSRGQILSRRLYDVIGRVVTLLFPTLVARRHEGDGRGFDRALMDTLRYALVGTLAATAVLGGASVGVMNVFGPGFAVAADAMTLLLLWTALSGATQILNYAIVAVDRPGLTSWQSAVRLVVTLSVSIACTAWLGLVGPAIGMVVAAFVDLLWKLRTVRAHMRSPLLRLWPAREVAALAFACAAGYFTSRGLFELLPGLAELPVVLLGGALAFAAAFWAVGGLNVRDRHRLAEGRARASARLVKPKPTPTQA